MPKGRPLGEPRLPMNSGHYRLHVKMISRRQGRAVCAAAAYRSGERIHDESYGVTFDYRPRTSIYDTEIRAPENVPKWATNRSQLWNRVEAFETRKNSQLAREFEVSLPQELPDHLKVEAVRSFVDQELVKRGMIADVCYHDFHGNKAHNPHAHILVTTRQLDGDTFAKKKTREWDKKDLLLHWRSAWAQHVNQILEQYGSETRIDHRSYAAQGIDLIPLHETRAVHYFNARQVATFQSELDGCDHSLAQLEADLLQAQELDKQHHLQTLIELGSQVARELNRQKTQPDKNTPATYKHAALELKQAEQEERTRLKLLLDQQRDPGR